MVYDPVVLGVAATTALKVSPPGIVTLPLAEQVIIFDEIEQLIVPVVPFDLLTTTVGL